MKSCLCTSPPPMPHSCLTQIHLGSVGTYQDQVHLDKQRKTSSNADPDKQPKTHQPPHKRPRSQRRTRTHIYTHSGTCALRKRAFRLRDIPQYLPSRLRIQKRSLAYKGDREATRACKVGHTDSKQDRLPQRPMGSGADMVTQTSRATITRPPDGQT